MRLIYLAGTVFEIIQKKEYICTMVKEYHTKEEKIKAFKNALLLKKKWEDAIDSGATREEMERMGIKTPNVTA